MKKIYLFLVSIILMIFFSYYYLESTKQVPKTAKSSYQRIKLSSTEPSKSMKSSMSTIVTIQPHNSSSSKYPKSVINESNSSKYSTNNNEVNYTDTHENNILYRAEQKVDLKTTKEAADYLRNILGYNVSNNIIVDGDGSQDGTDKNGKYYVIEIINLRHKLQGKTGLMGIYKVYTNGNYIRQV